MNNLELYVSAYWITGCIICLVDLQYHWDRIMAEVRDDIIIPKSVSWVLLIAAFVLATVAWPFLLGEYALERWKRK